MGFDGIKYTFGKSATSIWRADQTVRRKVIFARNNPGRAASSVAQAVADTALLRPTKAIGAIAIDIGKAIVEPIIWAAKGAVTGSQVAYDGVKMRRVLADARANQKWVVPSDVEGQSPQVDDALVNQLKYGIIGALAKADALHRTQKTVKVGWAAYGSHTGYMLAVKAAKVVLVAAAVHTPGINHLALAHFLSPASEEKLLDAMGLTTVASQVGVGAGILAAAHDGFAKSLRNTNLWEKDLETRQYQKEQVAVRKDLLLFEKALKSINVLKSETSDSAEDPKKVAQRHAKAVRNVQTGLLAAQRLQVDLSGNQLGQRFAGLNFNTQSLSARADHLLQRHNLSSSADALSFDDLASLPLAAPSKGAPAATASHQLVPKGVSRYMQRRKLQAEEATNNRLEARYQADLNRLKALTPDEEAAVDPGLRLTHVDNKRALAKSLSRLAATRRRVLDSTIDPEKAALRIQTLETTIKQLRDDIDGFRAYAGHPATVSSDTDWRAIAPRYAAEANLLAKQRINIEKKIASIDAGLTSVVSISQRDVMQFRKTKLASKLEIVKLKADKVGLDLALANLEERRLPPEASAAYSLMKNFMTMDVIENRRAHAIRDEAIAFHSGLRELSADRQKRTSVYVRPDAAPIKNAPSIVNTILKSAWYSVAVVPLVNLPYWGAVRAHAAWSNYRFLQAVQGATHDV